ncbi:MAG TPA: hypothetical protein ENJ08_09405 [Gammaproteobacteria bacterium]|nr:hypothetical protein [Gammaproteobacteria bacterium]
MSKPELKISILSDYICPFCFFGDLRLDVLREKYALKINWCLIEIHPETPASGVSTRLLNYSDEKWNSISKSLLELASEEGVQLCEQTRTTNSRRALLLAEACKSLGADIFYPLHQHIFKAFFIEGKNIGEEHVLRDIASQHNIPEQIIQQAWSDDFTDGPADSVPASLLKYLQYAGYLQASSVPTFIIGKQVLSGVITREKLIEAARQV